MILMLVILVIIVTWMWLIDRIFIFSPYVEGEMNQRISYGVRWKIICHIVNTTNYLTRKHEHLFRFSRATN